MAEVYYNENPTVSDLVLFNLETKDVDGNLIDPYSVNIITIYFIERGYATENINAYESDIEEQIQYFSEAIPIEVFGNADVLAWLSTDTSDSFIEKLTTDDDGNVLTGTFRLEWQPKLAREGNYVLCYSWRDILGGNLTYSSMQFSLSSDTTKNTSIPTHRTVSNKYQTLLERYLPSTFSMYLSSSDLTPDVLSRFNQAVADGFTILEDLVNQISDLQDANAVSEVFLPYLAKFFGARLYGQDTTLWRRQIKTAVSLYKKKGTISGLREALTNADIVLNSVTKLWQVVSKSTWQEAFTGGSSWVLEKLAVLPVESFNYKLYLNDVSVPLGYVSFVNSSGKTTMTWLSTPLEDDDVVRVIYKVSEPDDQSLEDYIRDLPLADQRIDTTYPKKNWNVKLIAEDDPMFDAIIPTKYPFTEPVVFGKIRTEFPYGENIYNMETYNASVRDSTDPCDIDKNFLDVCSYCQSSSYNIDLDIEDLSSERLEEVDDILSEFMPFHAVSNLISYSSTKSEFIPSPEESIELLLSYQQNDNVIATQMNFNRLIEEGSSDLLELKRDMLANTSVTYTSGTGKNEAVSIFSPGFYFDRIIDVDSNLLEILSGTYAGEYTLTNPSKYSMDLVEPISFPLDTSGFPFRISNIIYEDIVSIYRTDNIRFYDSSIEFVAYGTDVGYKIVILSGIYAGTYTITSVNTDNSVTLSGLSGSISASGLNYEIRTASSVLRYTGTGGRISTQQIGEVVCSSTAESVKVSPGDYVEYSGNQYKVLTVENDTSPILYIENYTGGNVVGVASISVYRRRIEGIGYLSVRGMQITGPIPYVDGTLEDNTFIDNYLILYQDKYYKITSIVGSTMTLSGTPVELGLTGVPISYEIVHFEKIPVTTQDGHYFEFLDRRGNDSIEIITETITPMTMGMSEAILNSQPVNNIGLAEKILLEIEYRKEKE